MEVAKVLLVLLSWLWIGGSAWLWGKGALRLLKRLTGEAEESLDMTVLSGLCLLTVYAQIFSLFYKVGLLASALLLLGNLVLFFVLRRDLQKLIKKAVKSLCSARKNLLGAAVFLALCFFVLALSSGRVTHYDSYLYHAQSIRWIEEYGVVPGLGNLHNRLAYNSSFFCLQALFSLKFLVGQSLHSMNGFIALVFLSYGVFSMKAFRQRRFFASDFLRLTLFVLYTNDFGYLLISSPGSDFPALGFTAYILIKWVSALEDGEKKTAPYAQLCLLGVFAVSLKLSAAMIVLLTLLPAVWLIRQKKWGTIAVYIASGLLIIAPFLARNVIISGYLLYPYEALDLFSPDWKMPAYTLAFDRNEIKAWGWGLNDVRLFDTPFREWFPVWFSGLSAQLKALFFASILSGAASVPVGLWMGIKKKDWNFMLVCGTMLCSMGLWFFGAPSPRYGMIYLTLLPFYILGLLAQRVSAFIKKDWIFSGAMATAVIVFLWPLGKGAVTGDLSHEKICADYDSLACTEYFLGDQVIYVPDQGDQAGYYAFPSTPYAARLDKIELRGENLKEGFRMKEEYREAFVSTYGEVYEENMFE